MTPIYAFAPIPQVGPSIFLAGPTPRDETTPSWRPKMLELLSLFPGNVFIPEAAPSAWAHDYDGQVEWELDALTAATVIVFWVPRDLGLIKDQKQGEPAQMAMPALTTNAEFGYWARSGKCVLGAPPKAPKLGYLRHLATRHGVLTVETMEDVARVAMYRASSAL